MSNIIINETKNIVRVNSINNNVIVTKTPNLVTISNKDGVQGPQGIPGNTGATIESVEFVGNDMVFTKDDSTTVILEDAKIDLKGDQGIQGLPGTNGDDGASIVSASFVGDDIVFVKDDATTVTLEDAKIDLKGDQGIQGLPGTNGTDGLDINWLGAYAGGTTYVVNDAVSYNGSSYICKLESTGNLPTNTTYWDLMAQKGTDASGDVISPATNTDSYIPQWNGTDSKTLKNGLPVTTWLQMNTSNNGNATISNNNTYNIDTKSIVKFHGVESNGAISFNDSTHIITVAGSTTYWHKGIRYYTASAITCDIDDYETLTANKLYFIGFDAAAGVLKASDEVWDLQEIVPVCTVFWNGSIGALSYENHDYRRDIDWHNWAHLTVGARYRSGLSLTLPTTTTDGSLQIESGEIYDEDLKCDISQQTTMRGFYQASAGVYTFLNYSLPYLGTAGAPLYLDTDTYALTTFAANRYINYWVYASTDISRPIYIIPSHVSIPYTTVSSARLETQPYLLGLGLSPEMKLIYRFTYAGNGQFQESSDYRLTSPLPSGGSASTTASAVAFNPSGTISATTVQSAIEELDAEKAAITELGAISITQADFYTAVTGATLSPGRWYLITDYKTQWKILGSTDSSEYHTGDAEEIYVYATTTSEVAPQGFSKTYPDEIIYFDANPLSITKDVYMYYEDGSSGGDNEVTTYSTNSFTLDSLTTPISGSLSCYGYDSIEDVEFDLGEYTEGVDYTLTAGVFTWINNPGVDFTNIFTESGSYIECSYPYVYLQPKGMITGRWNLTTNVKYMAGDYRGRLVRRYLPNSSYITNWSAGTYAVGKIVRYNNVLYQATVSTSATPSTSSTTWAAILAIPSAVTNFCNKSSVTLGLSATIAADTGTYTDVAPLTSNMYTGSTIYNTTIEGNWSNSDIYIYAACIESNIVVGSSVEYTSYGAVNRSKVFVTGNAYTNSISLSDVSLNSACVHTISSSTCKSIASTSGYNMTYCNIGLMSSSVYTTFTSNIMQSVSSSYFRAETKNCIIQSSSALSAFSTFYSFICPIVTTCTFSGAVSAVSIGTSCVTSTFSNILSGVYVAGRTLNFIAATPVATLNVFGEVLNVNMPNASGGTYIISGLNVYGDFSSITATATGTYVDIRNITVGGSFTSCTFAGGGVISIKNSNFMAGLKTCTLNRTITIDGVVAYGDFDTNTINSSIGTCTVSIASPAVIGYTAHGLVAGNRVSITTTGALPTGITAGTSYFVISAGLTANEFRIATSSEGTAINTSGSQSGTHTLHNDTCTITNVTFKGGAYSNTINNAFTGSEVGDNFDSNTVRNGCSSLNLPSNYSSKTLNAFVNYTLTTTNIIFAESLVAGESVTTGQVCYLKSDGKYWKAKADAVGTTQGRLVVANASISADATGQFITLGEYFTTGLTVGSEYYISAGTAGAITTTKPSTTGQFVRSIGYAKSSTVLSFYPSNTYIEVA